MPYTTARCCNKKQQKTPYTKQCSSSRALTDSLFQWGTAVRKYIVIKGRLRLEKNENEIGCKERQLKPGNIPGRKQPIQ